MGKYFGRIFRSIFIAFILLSQSEDSHGKEKCHYDIDIAWTSEVSNSLLASPALVADIDADDSVDIITAAFTEEVAVLQGSNGQFLSGSWPANMQDNSFHASPLLYDIDKDGRSEIMVCTSDGEVMFLDNQGHMLQGTSLKVPHLVAMYVMFERDVEITPSNINMFIKPFSPKVQDYRAGRTSDSLYVNVPPHVLATPVIADLNRDGVTEELILPVSYYFDKEMYRSDEDLASVGLPLSELDNYLAGGIVVYNLTSRQPIHQINLELTMVNDAYPGYVLFTPTVVDLEGDGGPLEMIVGTSAGRLYVINHNGKIRQGFPVAIAPMHGQITVEEITGDGRLDLVVIDTSGNVMCFDNRGNVQWEAEISGSSSPGSRVADVNQDGHLDVVIPTNNGYVWALQGNTGKVLPGWPIALSCKLLANVVIARLKPKPNPLDVIVPSYDHHLYVISGDGQCVEVIEVDERSLVPIIAADLMPTTPGLELLLGTNDGTVMCLRTQEEVHDGKGGVAMGDVEDWRAENPAHNRFTYWDGKVGIKVSKVTKEAQLVTGNDFNVRFEIVDGRSDVRGKMKYTVQVLAGQILLEPGKSFTFPGDYTLTVPTPNKPMRTVVTIQMTNQYGQVFVDSYAVSFNTRLAQDVQWLLFFPFIAMTLLLLLVHGYPEVDLLPLTHMNKLR
ncbi:uncharacterized protein [Amphiura filiformis]|uniref:uncharacterized protein n=1 Tax=Amphiura filiformis TaxID=82378 RepID=UPI003B219232